MTDMSFHADIVEARAREYVAGEAWAKAKRNRKASADLHRAYVQAKVARIGEELKHGKA